MKELTLPWPPSVNTYWRNFNGRTIISAKGREYREVVVHNLSYDPDPEFFIGAVKVEITAYRPDNRKRDLDNLLKAPLDALSHAGVWQDDYQITDLRIKWADTVGGMLKIKISGTTSPDEVNNENT
jgi:crossover junction endodeoxyribonuclease RusA